MTVICSPLLNRPRNYQGRAEAYHQYLELRKQKLNEKQTSELELSIFTESAKEYRNYLPKGNLPLIIAKFNNTRRFKEKIIMEAESLNSTRLEILKEKRRKLV